MYNELGNYGFDFIDSTEAPPIRLVSVGVEKRSDKSYYFDNRFRSPSILFQYTLSGSGTVVIDGQEREVVEGQAFYLKIPGNEKYYFEESTNKAPWHFIYLQYSGTGVDGYYNRIKERCGSLVTLPISSPPIITLTEIYRLARHGTINDPFTCDRLCFEFLCKLCTECISDKTTYSETVSLAIDIIKREYAILEGIDSIANRLGVSHSHLTRSFIDQVGYSPIAYLTAVRIKHSMELLVQTDLTIEEIAKACGYLNGNYFCKVFRRSTNTSPKKYRDSVRKSGYDDFRIL